MQLQEAKKQIKWQEWSQVLACRNSEGSVKQWCEQNGIHIKTYYYRLQVVREC